MALRQGAAERPWTGGEGRIPACDKAQSGDERTGGEREREAAARGKAVESHLRMVADAPWLLLDVSESAETKSFTPHLSTTKGSSDGCTRHSRQSVEAAVPRRESVFVDAMICATWNAASCVANLDPQSPPWLAMFSTALRA